MAKDILLDQEGDLLFKDGDFVIGESDQQHIEDLLITNIGGNKAAPLLSVGLVNYLSSPNTASSKQKLKKEINMMLKADGASNVFVDVSHTINVSGKYE